MLTMLRLTLEQLHALCNEMHETVPQQAQVMEG